MKTQTTDFRHRQQAVTEIHQNVIVMAGAGTGKTTLLISRLLLLLLGERIPIDQIVALTFTKKAAEEMRERLETKLRSIIKGDPPPDELAQKYSSQSDEWAALCEQALAQMPKAQITTIHSFAGTILRLFPIQSRIDPNFREDDGTLATPHFETAWRAWLAKELGAASKNKKMWMDLFAITDLDDLKNCAKAMVFSCSDVLHDDSLVDLASLARSWLGEWQALINAHGLPDQARSFSPGVRAVEATFAAMAEGKNLSQKDFELLDNMPTKMPKSWGDSAELQRQVNRMVARALALHRVDAAFMKKICKLLAPFLAELKTELNRQGIVHHDQVLFQTRNLLSEYEDVRTALKRKYRTFLIDEFQDTDPLQGEILFYLGEKLASFSKDWRNVTLEPGRLFVVGDPKQSIYRFRGADIGAFDEFKQLMIKQGALELSLTSNFRSQSPILAMINHLFDIVMKANPYVQPDFIPLDATREFSDSSDHPVEVLHLTYEQQEEKIKAEPSLAFEAHLIAEWISKNVGTKLNGNDLRYRDVALLFRTSTPFPIFAEALRDRGIPFLVEGEKTFYRRPEIVEFVNLLACLANPSDELAFAGVLRSPLGALTDTELFLLKKKASLDYRNPPAAFENKLTQLYRSLNELANAATYLSVADFLNETFQKTWLLELASRMRHGEQAVANLLKVQQLATLWADGMPLTLTRFVKLLSDHRDEEKDEGENPLSDAQFDAVKIMTIHKSKGLEFPVVFLPNLAGKSGKNQNRPHILRDWRRSWQGLHLPKAEKMNAAMLILEDEGKSHEEAEEVRVFYVATTRAKEKLILITRAGDHLSDAMSYLTQANLLNAAQKHVHFKTQEWQPVVVAERKSEKKASTPIEQSAHQLAQSFKNRLDEYELLKKDPIFLSPSRVMHEEEKEYLVDEETILIRTEAILIGLMCHKVLEEWDFLLPQKRIKLEVEKRLESAAKVFEVFSDENGEALYAEAKQILENYVQSEAYRSLSKSRVVGREIPFFYPQVSSGNDSVMRGVIDVLFERDGQLVVGDYKTSRVNEKTLETVAKSYATQGKIYQEAIKRALGQDVQFELIFLRTGQTVTL